MMVIVLISAPSAVKGFVSRYLMEVSSSTYIGSVPKNIREDLWEFVCENIKNGQALLLYSFNNAQGYEIMSTNFSNRVVTELDGVMLMKQIHRGTTQKGDKQKLAGKKGWSKLSYYKRR